MNIYKKKYKKVYPRISTYLNMDMIGRLDKNLIVQGMSSNKEWPQFLEDTALNHKLSLIAQNDPYVPSDGMAFYLAGVPSLSFFTGAHEDYHTPRDNQL